MLAPAVLNQLHGSVTKEQVESGEGADNCDFSNDFNKSHLLCDANVMCQCWVKWQRETVAYHPSWEACVSCLEERRDITSLKWEKNKTKKPTKPNKKLELTKKLFVSG